MLGRRGRGQLDWTGSTTIEAQSLKAPVCKTFSPFHPPPKPQPRKLGHCRRGGGGGDPGGSDFPTIILFAWTRSAKCKSCVFQITMWHVGRLSRKEAVPVKPASSTVCWCSLVLDPPQSAAPDGINARRGSCMQACKSKQVSKQASQQSKSTMLQPMQGPDRNKWRCCCEMLQCGSRSIITIRSRVMVGWLQQQTNSARSRDPSPPPPPSSET